MKKLDTSAFSVVEVLVVLVIVGLIAAVGWLVYDRQNNKTNNQQATIQKSDASAKTKEKDEVENSIKVDYSSWSKVSDEELDENETARYKSKSGSATLKVFKTRPIIKYSSNAPVYCAYEDDAWINYTAIGTNPLKFTKDQNSNACKSIEKTQLSNMTAHTRYGGALGHTTLSAVIENNSEWFVFIEGKYQDNVNLTDTEETAIKSGLHTSIEDLISKTFVK